MLAVPFMSTVSAHSVVTALYRLILRQRSDERNWEIYSPSRAITDSEHDGLFRRFTFDLLICCQDVDGCKEMCTVADRRKRLQPHLKS